MDGIAVILREFGWQVGGAAIIIFAMATAIRVLASRLEKAYQDQIATLKEHHAGQLKEAREACIREVSEVRAYGERGWAMADTFRVQSERLTDRLGETAPILRDLANDIFEARRGRSGRGA